MLGLVLGLVGGTVGTSTTVSADAHQREVFIGEHISSSCTPYSWSDYRVLIYENMTDINLLFEVEDTGTAFNPTGLRIALWETEVPPDRSAEHKRERATGKVWAVGMNNDCFAAGWVTLGVQCGPTSMTYVVHLIPVTAPLEVYVPVHGEVCPGEWVYHFVNTATLGAGHYGSGHHLEFSINKNPGGGGATAVTRHGAAPIKLVPPYVRIGDTTSTANISMCNVEEGPMYLGLYGEQGGFGCVEYDITVSEFMSECNEMLHSPELSPAALADQTLPVEHFERASCAAHNWYDFYFNVTQQMIEEEDNLVFEVEVIATSFELSALSVHLYQGAIPLDRSTQRVSTVPDGAIYSIAVPSIELVHGPLYLSIKCGPNPQRFRTVAFVVRGMLRGPGDAVHGEVCPNEFLYHSIVPTFTDATTAVVDAGAGRRLGMFERRRRLAGGAPNSVLAIEPGTHVEYRFIKHAGDFVFMSLVGSLDPPTAPPTRKQPPSRTIHYNEIEDYGIFCNLEPGNKYWIALLGGGHCATYDLEVRLLNTSDAATLSRFNGVDPCATGEYSLVPNEFEATGVTPLTKEVPTYGQCGPNEYVDFSLALTMDHDFDENMRFQVQLKGQAVRPEAITLLVYQDGVVPVDRSTEIFSDRAVDGITSLIVNTVDLKFQLCNAINFAHPDCAHGSGAANTTNATSGAVASGGHRRTLSDELIEEYQHRRLSASSSGASADGSAPTLTYFVSVQCAASGSASFKLLATAIPSHLQTGVSIHGELCPGAMVYHHWEHYSVGETKSVRFRITKHGGDGAVMVRHGASIDDAPLKLAPPYVHLGEDDHHAYVEYCNVTDATTTNEHVYVMFSGGEHCMSYEIMAEEEPNEVCHELGHGMEHLASAEYATPMSPHHFVYGSCFGNDWVDYSMTLAPSDYHYNFLIEVEDLDTYAGGMSNAEALSLHQFDYQIPVDRMTEHRATRAVDGVYSIAINLHNFHPGMSFFSVRCNNQPKRRRFRTVIYQIEQILQAGHEYHGEVCPGEWVYHTFDVPADGSASNFQFHLVKHTGDLEIVVRHGVIPLKLIPPFTHAGYEDFEVDTQVCRSEAGERVYLGMLGGEHCASYEISVSAIPPSLPCAEPDHSATSLAVDPDQQHPMVWDHFVLGSCAPYGWFDMYVDVTRHDMHNNMLFELEERSSSGAVDAVNVFLWAGSVPLTRNSQYKVTRSFGGVYSLAVSMHEFEPFLESHDAGGHGRRLSADGGGGGSSGPAAGSVRFFFGVQCGPEAIDFRSFVHLVHSDLSPGHTSHGEVCAGEWIYHVLPINNALINSRADGGGGHRRLTATEADALSPEEHAAMVEEDMRIRAAAIDAKSGATRYVDEPDGRRLSAASGADRPGVHLRFHVTKNIGQMSVVVALNDKPLRLVPPYTVMDSSDTAIDEIICNADDYLVRETNRSTPMKYYLAIAGGSVCSHYEVSIEAISSADQSCSELRAAAMRPSSTLVDESHGTPGARSCPRGSADCILSMRHYMRAECDPHERAPPFIIQVPYTAGGNPDNLVVEVEDLNVQDNPTSLHLSIYSATGSHEELMAEDPLLTSTQARKRIFSLGFSSIEMEYFIIATACGGNACSSDGQANFSLVVACNAQPVKFSVIAMFTTLSLTPGVPVHGEVCPGNWIFHRLLVHDTNYTHAQSGVHFELHVHQGDIYYMMSRWAKTPGFAACNENEMPMTSESDGSVDLCRMGHALEHATSDIFTVGTYTQAEWDEVFSAGGGGDSRRRLQPDGERLLDEFIESGGAAGMGAGEAPHGRRLSALGNVGIGQERPPLRGLISTNVAMGYVGLYGGRSCAHYTIETRYIPPGQNCTPRTTSSVCANE